MLAFMPIKTLAWQWWELNRTLAEIRNSDNKITCETIVAEQYSANGTIATVLYARLRPATTLLNGCSKNSNVEMVSSFGAKRGAEQQRQELTWKS